MRRMSAGHLSVPVELDHRVGTAGDGMAIAGQGGAANALVVRMGDDDDSRIPAVLAHLGTGLFRTGIIHDVDPADLLPDPGDDLQYLLADAKTGDDDRDAAVRSHGSAIDPVA